jgi:glycosyltransferase involved in cell wall biosynthesis
MADDGLPAMAAEPGATGSGRPPGLFVVIGAFSHANANLRAGFREIAPDLRLDEYDVLQDLRRRRLTLLRCLLAAVLEYGPGALRSGGRLRYALFRSCAFHQALGRLIAERMRGGGYGFTLQTQSIANAATGLAPNFVYTDHVARSRSAWDDGFGDPSPAWLALEERIYLDAAHVFTFGSGIRRKLIEEYGVSPQKVSRAGAGASARPATAPDDGIARYARRNILFVGVEWERKGGPDLIEAFARVRERLHDATLTIVGCRPEVCVAGVEVIGRVPLAEVEGFFRRASCFCMPSRLEPFGIVFVEAAHFALPVVATTVGDIADVVQEGETGHLVAPSDPEALAAALIATLEDAETCRRMGRASAALAVDLTWAKVAERIAAHLPGVAIAETSQ